MQSRKYPGDCKPYIGNIPKLYNIVCNYVAANMLLEACDLPQHIFIDIARFSAMHIQYYRAIVHEGCKPGTDLGTPRLKLGLYVTWMKQLVPAPGDIRTICGMDYDEASAESILYSLPETRARYFSPSLLPGWVPGQFHKSYMRGRQWLVFIYIKVGPKSVKRVVRVHDAGSEFAYSLNITTEQIVTRPYIMGDIFRASKEHANGKSACSRVLFIGNENVHARLLK